MMGKTKNGGRKDFHCAKPRRWGIRRGEKIIWNFDNVQKAYATRKNKKRRRRMIYT
jgi:hypothetical protein